MIGPSLHLGLPSLHFSPFPCRINSALFRQEDRGVAKKWKWLTLLQQMRRGCALGGFFGCIREHKAVINLTSKLLPLGYFYHLCGLVGRLRSADLTGSCRKPLHQSLKLSESVQTQAERLVPKSSAIKAKWCLKWLLKETGDVVLTLTLIYATTQTKTNRWYGGRWGGGCKN